MIIIQEQTQKDDDFDDIWTLNSALQLDGLKKVTANRDEHVLSY